MTELKELFYKLINELKETMSTLKEMEAQVLKVKERSRERLKIINQLTEENKELKYKINSW